MPAVGGNEGVGEVIGVGSNVSDLEVSDFVIPGVPGLGTWRTHLKTAAENLVKVPKDIPPEYLATVSINPCTAYRLLEDFVQLKSGRD